MKHNSNYNLPEKFENETAQFEDKVNDSNVIILYDDAASQLTTVNQYAMFTTEGFCGWLPLGFVKAQIEQLLENENDKMEYNINDFIVEDEPTEIGYNKTLELFEQEYNDSSNDQHNAGEKLKADYDNGDKEYKEGIDRGFRALCGYSFKTLCNRVEGKDDDAVL